MNAPNVNDHRWDECECSHRREQHQPQRTLSSDVVTRCQGRKGDPRYSTEPCDCFRFDLARSYASRRDDERARSRRLRNGDPQEEAQAHCQDPQTSSSTCTSKTGRARTRRLGAWFDGYQEDKW